METERIELFENVFCDVFENLAFMFGELVEKTDLPTDNTDYVQARMTFSGAQSGKIILAVPAEMCPEIAANVLGLDPDDEQVHDLAEDALKELINILCGQLLTGIAGVKPVFDLSVPDIRNISSAEWTELLNTDGSLGFIVDDYPVVFYFKMEQ